MAPALVYGFGHARREQTAVVRAGIYADNPCTTFTMDIVEWFELRTDPTDDAQLALQFVQYSDAIGS
jgi:hypothetical protein